MPEATEILASLTWAERTVGRYGRFGIPREDLVAEAHVGLVEASHRYDGSTGASFRTYASWWIRKRVVDRIVADRFFVRLPRHRLELLRAVRAAQSDLVSRLGRRPTPEETAESVGAEVGEIERLLAVASTPLSLEDPISDPDGPRRIDGIQDRGFPPPDDIAERDEAWTVVSGLLGHLPPRQRRALQLRFGLDESRESTYAEVGRRLGVSRERARQLVCAGVARIRKGLA